MATDFFQQQDSARRRTFLLVVYFVLAILVLVVLVYGLVLVLGLQEELTSTENKIGFARQAFNDAAANYNIRREVFPAVKVAGMFGFKEAALLETAETERAAPTVSFR